MNPKIAAGEFDLWVSDFLSTMRSLGQGDVPCGDCSGCCTSSKFIHLRPTDLEALKVIPQEILFSAPGLPLGHFLMGYTDQGHCPMFLEGKCSIYQSRPETCRQYDCRVLSATNTPTDEESSVIAERIQSWEFSYSTQRSVRLKSAVQDAYGFLNEFENEFPDGFLPPFGSQRSAMAIRVHEVFLTEMENQDKIQRILELCQN